MYIPQAAFDGAARAGAPSHITVFTALYIAKAKNIKTTNSSLSASQRMGYVDKNANNSKNAFTDPDSLPKSLLEVTRYPPRFPHLHHPTDLFSLPLRSLYFLSAMHSTAQWRPSTSSLALLERALLLLGTSVHWLEAPGRSKTRHRGSTKGEHQHVNMIPSQESVKFSPAKDSPHPASASRWL